ncbi:MAG: PAS domain-containing protein [Candidatus Brocadiia bacterium]
MCVNNMVSLPTGNLGLDELLNILNTLPVDITFVDKDDKVRYFSETKGRIFVRPRTIIGREVKNCHPAKSLAAVEKIIKSFKDGTKDSHSFWINLQGKMVYIRYFAVRDSEKKYMGTLEVTQDITDIKKIEGEKRLMDA